MFCENCGNQLDDNAKVCPVCGTPVEEEFATASNETVQVPQQGVAPSPMVTPPPVPTATAATEENAQKAFGLPKKVLVGIAGVVGALVIAAGGVAFAGPISRALAPEKAYRNAEQEYLESMVEDLMVSYDNGIKNLTNYNNTGAEIEVSASLGETVVELIDELARIDLGENAEVGLKLGAAIKENKYLVNGSLLWGSKALLAPEVVANLEESELYVTIPELDKKALLFDLEDLTGEDLSDVTEEGYEIMERLSKAYPKSKTLQSMISSYLKAALAAIEDDMIEHTKKELKVGGVKQKCTQYTITMDAEELAQVGIAFLEAMQEDERIEELLVTFVDAMEADIDGDDVFNELEEEIEYLIEDLERVGDVDVEFEMVVYVGSDGDIYGREITLSDNYDNEIFLSLLAPESGSKWAFELEVGEDKNTLVELSAEGKLSGEKRSGELECTIDGIDIGVLQLKDVCVENILRGEFSGTLSYALEGIPVLGRLERELDYIVDDLPSGVDDIVEDLVHELDTAVIEISLDSTLEKANATISLKIGEDKPEELVALSLGAANTSGQSVKIPSNVVEIGDEDDLMDWVEELDFDALLTQLEKKGLPEDILDLLETLVEYID